MRRHWWRFALTALFLGAGLPMTTMAEPAEAAPASVTFVCPPGTTPEVCAAVNTIELTLKALELISPGLAPAWLLGIMEDLTVTAPLPDYEAKFDAILTEVCGGGSTAPGCVEWEGRDGAIAQRIKEAAKEAALLEELCAATSLGWWFGCPEPDPAIESEYGQLIAGATFYHRAWNYGDPAEALPAAAVDLRSAGATTLQFWIKNHAVGNGGHPIAFGGIWGGGHWSITNDSGCLFLYVTNAALSTLQYQSLGACNTSEPMPWHLITITKDTGGNILAYNGETLVANFASAVPSVGAPQTAFGTIGQSYPAAHPDGWMWAVRHYVTLPHLLTQPQIAALNAFGSDQTLINEGDFNPEPAAPEAPVRPGTEDEPTPTTELAPTSTTMPPTPSSIVPPANPTGTHEERQTGLLENLVSGVASGFNWLGGFLGGLLRSVVDMIRWLGDIFGYWIRWLWERLGALLRQIKAAINSLGDLFEWMLQQVINGISATTGVLWDVLEAIWRLPALIGEAILSGLYDLFVPAALPEFPPCADTFPCNWVEEVNATIGGIKSGIDGSGACVAPVIGWSGGFEASFPPPPGCSGGNAGAAGANDATAGDLFGWRSTIRNVFALALWVGFIAKLLQMAPWSRPGDMPLGEGQVTV